MLSNILLLCIIKCLLQCCWIKMLDLYLLPYQFPWVVTVLEMTIICRRSQNEWTWKSLNVQLLIICSLHIMSNSTNKQSSSLIFMTKTGSSWKWPYGNLKWTDYVHSLIRSFIFLQQPSFSSSNRFIDSPFRLHDLSNKAWILVYILL